MLRDKRSDHNEKPTHCNKEKPPLTATTENPTLKQTRLFQALYKEGIYFSSFSQVGITSVTKQDKDCITQEIRSSYVVNIDSK